MKTVFNCVRHADGDYFLEKREDNKWTARTWVICGDKTNEWWAIKGEPRIEVILNTRPFESGYKCKYNFDACMFFIQDPGTQKWHTYGLFSVLSNAILDLGSTGKFYLGVNIPQ